MAAVMRNAGGKGPGQQRQPDHGERRSSPYADEPATNRPPAMVPIRIAMKVAPSTSALPVASSPTVELVGQHRVFHRAEQRRDDAEQRQRHEQQRDRMQEEAGGRKAGGEDLGEFQPPRDDRS